MSLGNEYTLVEKPAIDYFKSLGYSYINGKELTPESGERESFKEVILHNCMFNSLKKLNPEISEQNVKKVIRILQRPDNLGSGLLEINEASTLVQESCDPEANIIFGTSVRDDLDDNVMLTVIATDFE